MKFITWNCNGAFRKKFKQFLTINPDICIIQECEDPNQEKCNELLEWVDGFLWIGHNKNSGLGIFSRNGHSLSRMDWDDHNLKLFLPCRIDQDLCLVGVWAQQANSPTFQYIGQIWKYLHIHLKNFKPTQMIMAGDFNSNSMWDVWDRWWNHSDVVKMLADANIDSFYHALYGETHGEETSSTFFMHRKPDKAYHIDYFFGSTDLFSKLETLSIGNLTQWLEWSDHVPIVININL